MVANLRTCGERSVKEEQGHTYSFPAQTYRDEMIFSMFDGPQCHNVSLWLPLCLHLKLSVCVERTDCESAALEIESWCYFSNSNDV